MAASNRSRYRDALVAGLQSGFAAGVAWLIGSWVLPDAPLYAPIAAIVVIGAGYERRVGRVKSMLVGMAIAIAISEVGVRMLGTGSWQVGVLTGLSIIVTRLAVGDLLAVAYAGINAAVLAGLGVQGWLPSRTLEAVIGALTAYALIYLVFPPRPDHYVQRAIAEEVSPASDAMDEIAGALGSEAESARGWKDSELVDRRLDRVIDNFDFSEEVSRFSPWRRREKNSVKHKRLKARRLQGVLRQATTLVRVATRLADDQEHREGHLSEAISFQSEAIGLLGEVVAGSERDTSSTARAASLAEKALERAEEDCADRRGVHTATVEAIKALSLGICQMLEETEDPSGVRLETTSNTAE